MGKKILISFNLPYMMNHHLKCSSEAIYYLFTALSPWNQFCHESLFSSLNLFCRCHRAFLLIRKGFLSSLASYSLCVSQLFLPALICER